MNSKVIIDVPGRRAMGVTTKRELKAHFTELKEFMARIQAGG